MGGEGAGTREGTIMWFISKLVGLFATTFSCTLLSALDILGIQRVMATGGDENIGAGALGHEEVLEETVRLNVFLADVNAKNSD